MIPTGQLDRVSRLPQVRGSSLGERESALGDLLLPGRDQAFRSALGEQLQQLALGVWGVANLPRRGHAERSENQIAEPVEQIDHRLGGE